MALDDLLEQGMRAQMNSATRYWDAEYARGMQQAREPTPEEQAQYNRLMMNAVPAISHPDVEPVADRWPPREPPESVVAVLHEFDWLYFYWVLAGAVALFIRWGLTH